MRELEAERRKDARLEKMAGPRRWRHGKRFGRPSALNKEQQLTVIARINAGVSISAIAREFNTTRQTILRVKVGQNES